MKFLHATTWTWRFHGGPLDGLELEIPEGVGAPSELAWREERPPRELVYRLRPLGNVFTAASLLRQERDFDCIAKEK